MFNYTLYDAETNQLVAKGHSIQVFLDRTELVLQLSNPPFFEEWKKRHELY